MLYVNFVTHPVSRSVMVPDDRGGYVTWMSVAHTFGSDVARLRIGRALDDTGEHFELLLRDKVIGVLIDDGSGWTIKLPQARRPRSPNLYFRLCPRGFANEITIWRVTPDQARVVERDYEDYVDRNPGTAAQWIDPTRKQIALATACAAADKENAER